jgi:purine-cytosine permease-like protein
MLSDAEYQRLSEIETAFRATDPAFVRQFERSRQHQRARRTGALVVLMLGAMVTVLALVAGTTAVAILGLIVTAAAACVLEHRPR